MDSTIRIEKFCCCCTVRTGTLVTGTIGWLLSSLIIISTQLTITFPGNADYNASTEVSLRNLVVPIVFGLMSLGLYILLIIGVYKKNNKFFLPWLILGFIGCMLITAHLLLVVCEMKPGDNIIVFILFIILLVLFNIFSWYSWLCVWSHYVELRESTIFRTVEYHFNDVNSSP